MRESKYRLSYSPLRLRLYYDILFPPLLCGCMTQMYKIMYIYKL